MPISNQLTAGHLHQSNLYEGTVESNPWNRHNKIKCMISVVPFFFFQTTVPWPFQKAYSMAAPLQMPMYMFCRKIIIILLEYLQ